MTTRTYVLLYTATVILITCLLALFLASPPAQANRDQSEKKGADMMRRGAQKIIKGGEMMKRATAASDAGLRDKLMMEGERLMNDGEMMLKDAERKEAGKSMQDGGMKKGY